MGRRPPASSHRTVIEGPPLQRHRLVNEAVAEELKAIHAFSIKAWTPAQFAAKQAGQ